MTALPESWPFPSLESLALKAKETTPSAAPTGQKSARRKQQSVNKNLNDIERAWL
jgi:hypothetical protein